MSARLAPRLSVGVSRSTPRLDAVLRAGQAEALRIGVRTGVNVEPPTSRRRRVSHDDDYDATIAPPPASLQGIPSEVIEILVKQAAISAREVEDNVPKTICQWMHNFCEVAASSKVPCNDDWFRIALNAFGKAPEPKVGGMVFADRQGKTTSGYVDIHGNEVPAPGLSAPPPQSGFKTWRHLFEQLCIALNGPARVTRHAPPSFWDRVAQLIDGTYPKPRSHYRNLFARWDLPQRTLDTYLHMLITLSVRSPTAQNVSRVHSWWEEWKNGETSNAFGKVPADPWKALVTWMTLRGAVPFKEKYYRKIDMSMYIAVVNAMNGDISWDEALKSVKEALALGGTINFNRNEDLNELESGLAEFAPTLQKPPLFAEYDLDWPSPESLALRSGNHDLVKLLLDADQHQMFVYRDYDLHFVIFEDALMAYLQDIETNVRLMPEGDEKRGVQETTLKLIAQLDEYVTMMMEKDNNAQYEDLIRQIGLSLQTWKNADQRMAIAMERISPWMLPWMPHMLKIYDKVQAYLKRVYRIELR